jgi:PTS system fructose-specific IIA component/PTS system nitrogen regulatory IIA component
MKGAEDSIMHEFLSPSALLPSMTATTRDEAIRELVQSLSNAGLLPSSDVDMVVGAILERESISSTGIGYGVAIPHSRHRGVNKLACTMGISQKGIPFDAIDGQPVHLIILVISNPNFPIDHLKALERSVRTFAPSNPDSASSIQKLKAVTSKEEMWSVIRNLPEPWVQ